MDVRSVRTAVPLLSTTNVTAGPGASSFFDVEITNPSTYAFTVGAYTFDLEHSSSDITFTSTVSTDYPTDLPPDHVFPSPTSIHETSGGVVPFEIPGTTATNIAATDISTALGAGGMSVAPGETYNLGRVYFDVAAAPTSFGFVPISFLVSATGPERTDLADGSGVPMSFTVDGGAIKVDPGLPFVDCNNDGVFQPGTDLEITTQLDDGKFDTASPEGLDCATVSGGGPGLVISGPAIVNKDVRLTSDGHMIINTDLTATKRNVELESRGGDVSFDDPTTQAKKKIRVTAAGDITSEHDNFIATSGNSNVVFEAGNDIIFVGTNVSAGRTVSFDAGGDVNINPNSTVDVTGSRGRTTIHAANVDVSGSMFTAGLGVDIEATAGNVNVSDTKIVARVNRSSHVDIKAAGSVDGNAGTEIEANKTVDIKSGGEINLPGAKLLADRHTNASVHVDAGTTLDIIAAAIAANKRIKVESGGNLDATDAVMAACGHPASDVRIAAGGDATLVRLKAGAQKLIKVEAALAIDLTMAELGIIAGTTGDILIDGTTYDITGATLKRPDKLTLKGTQVGSAAADTTKGTLPCPSLPAPPP